MAHAIGHRQVAAAEVFEQREPVARLPMNARIDPSLRQGRTQRVAFISGHANLIKERRDVVEIG